MKTMIREFRMARILFLVGILLAVFHPFRGWGQPRPYIILSDTMRFSNSAGTGTNFAIEGNTYLKKFAASPDSAFAAGPGGRIIRIPVSRAISQYYDSTSFNHDSTKYIYYNGDTPVDSVSITAAANLATTNLIQTGNNRTYNGNGKTLLFSNFNYLQFLGGTGNAGSIRLDVAAVTINHNSSVMINSPSINFPTLTQNNTLNKVLVIDNSFAGTMRWRDVSSISPAETDPTVSSYIKTITAAFFAHGETAFGWGNHASAGYVTGGSIVFPGAIYNTPAIGVVSSGNITYLPTLISQAAYTNFGNRTSFPGGPTFFTNPFSDSLKISGDTIYQMVNGIWRPQFKTRNQDSTFLQLTAPGLGASLPTNNKGIYLVNPTPATASVFQNTPVITLEGQGWKINSTASSQPVQYQIYGTSGAAATVAAGIFKIDIIENGGRINILNWNSVGQLTTLSNFLTLSNGGLNASNLNTFTRSANGTLVLDALVINNPSVSTASIPQQYSPSIHQAGTAWNGSASQTYDFRQEARGLNGTNPITSKWALTGQISGGGYSDLFSVTNSGLLQTINQVIGGSTKAASALTDMQSTSQGLLLPRMTKAQRDAIGSPATGLTIWQTDNAPGIRSFNGTNWMKYTETTD